VTYDKKNALQQRLPNRSSKSLDAIDPQHLHRPEHIVNKIRRQKQKQTIGKVRQPSKRSRRTEETAAAMTRAKSRRSRATIASIVAFVGTAHLATLVRSNTNIRYAFLMRIYVTEQRRRQRVRRAVDNRQRQRRIERNVVASRAWLSNRVCRSAHTYTNYTSSSSSDARARANRTMATPLIEARRISVNSTTSSATTGFVGGNTTAGRKPLYQSRRAL
jgi:hypothetical protein